MKHKFLILPTLIGALCFSLGYSVNHSQQPVLLDLPDDWETISDDSARMDMLVGYLVKDTLHIEFEYEQRFKKP